MLSKVLSVVQSKAALAVLGVVLVGGGGTAAAYAATGHQLPLMGTQAQSTEKPDSANNGNHAHSVSIEGVLKSANGSTITVSSTSGEQPDATDKPDATHAAEATEKPEATHAAEATEKPEATETSDKSEATKTPTTYTITVNKDTRVNGDQASTLADLAKNVGHKVEVQAEKQSDGSLVAWKVTVGGVEGGDSSHSTSGGDNATSQTHVLSGTIKSVGTGSFVISVDGTSKTVTVNGQTQFRGMAHSAADLKAGVRVTVVGSTQTDGSFLATSVEVEGN